MLLKMSIQNLFRHRRRTLLTTLTIAVGVGVFLWADGIYRGMHRQMAENIIRYAEGSLSVTTQEYASGEQAFPLKHFIHQPQDLSSQLLVFPSIEGVSPRVPFLMEIIVGEKSLHGVGYVIDSKRDEGAFDLSQTIVKGRYLQGEENEVLIGFDLARLLGVDVEDEVLVFAQTKHGTMNVLSLVVKGIYRTSHPALDESSLYISYETAKHLLGLEENDVISLHIRISWPKGESIKHYTERVNKLKMTIASSLPDYRVVSFAEKYEEVFALMKMDEGFMYIMLGVIFLIAAVGIMNTILMAIHERIKEIGVMRAMGFSTFEIRLLFTFEGMGLGFIGGVGGTVIGILLNAYQVYIGYDMQAMGFTEVSGSDFGFPIWGVIYGDWNPSAFIVAFVFAVVMSTMAALISSRHATRISIVECIRFV